MTNTSIGLQELRKRLSDKAKAEKSMRGLNIPAIRDRVVQGAVKLIMEPVLEADFQPGSFGYRPNKTPHEALERTSEGLGKYLRHVIDLDLKSYFDTVRHDILLRKISARFNDDDLMWLCNKILKSSGTRGVAQGSVIGPLWANLYLNDVDRMLEQAQKVTRDGKYERVRYVRFADDIIILVSDQPFAQHWQGKVEKRLREELTKLDLTINEDKSKIVKFKIGTSFDFLGYTFQCCPDKKNPKQPVVMGRPQRKRRTAFLREIKKALDRNRHTPVEKVVKEILNPRIRGWVNYFRWRNAGDDLAFVKSEVERKLIKFALRQRHKKRRGSIRRTWSKETFYDVWGLYSDYHTIPSLQCIQEG
ncbi:MAG: reverse transcriptase domain-containing protein [Proteobacteria bacterium]|nr:reverse transcriptase domain-containing protein [Pseudomonadota bacterium]